MLEPYLYKNVIQTFGTEDLRSIGMTHGSSSKVFTADIQYADVDYTNFETISNNLQYSGKADCDFIESTNYTARPADELKEDDLIQITIDGVTYRYEVASACNASTDKVGRIYLKQRLLVDFDAITVAKVSAKVSNSGRSSLVLPLPNSKVASILTNDTDTGITYYSRKQFIESVTIDGTTNEINIAAQELDFGQQQFAPFNQGDYVIEVYNAGATTTRYGGSTGDIVQDGDVLYVDSSMVTINSGTGGNIAGSLDIKLPSDYFYQSGALNLADMKLKISCTIETQKAKPKAKTAVKNYRISIASDIDNEIIPLRGDNYDNPTGQVKSFSDVYRLRYVYEGQNFGIAPTVNEVWRNCWRFWY